MNTPDRNAGIAESPRAGEFGCSVDVNFQGSFNALFRMSTDGETDALLCGMFNTRRSEQII
jgi:hypothetical protein